MAADEVLGSGSITVELVEGNIDSDVRALGASIQRTLDRASRVAGRSIVTNISRALNRISPASVRVTADVDAAQRAIASLGTTLDAGPVRVDVLADVRAFSASLAALDGGTVRVRLEPDFSGFDAAVRAHRAPDVTVNVNAAGGLGSLGGDADRATGSVGRLAGAVRGLGASFGSLGALGGALVDIRNLAGGAAALPAVLSAAAVSVGVLKLALSGAGEALGSALTASTEEFQKTLEGLTPALAKTATEVRGLKPGLDSLRDSVQGAFFGQLAGDFTRLGEAMAPLKAQAAGLSSAFGSVASELLKSAASPAVIDSLRSSFAAVTPAVTSLSAVVGPLVQLFAQASKAVTDAFGGSAAGLIDGFASKLQGLADAGTFGAAAVKEVQGFGLVLKSIGEVADAVGGILSGLFSAADTAGATSLTGILGTLLGVLDDFVNSAPVQSGLTAIFQAFNQIIPVVAALATAVGQIAGPAFAAFASALLPVVSALTGALMPVIPTLTSAFQTVVTALSPLVTLLGSTLASVIGALAPLLGTVAGLFAQVATAIAPLITQITGALVPVFAQMAPLVSTLVTALVPLVTALVDALLPVLPPVIDALLAIFNAVTPVIPVVTALATAILGFGTTLITALAPVLQFVAGVVSWTSINVVVPIIEAVVARLTSIIGAVTSVITAVSGFVTTVVGFFSNFGTNVNTIISTLVVSVVAFFSSLRTRVLATVSALVNSVVGFFQSLPGRALSAVSSLVGLLTGVFNSAKSAVLSAATTLVSEAVGLIRELPGKAKAALGGLGSLLVSAGQDLIRGLINGVASMAGAIADKAKSVVSGAVSAAKSALGISSPSKVFRVIGVQTGQGLVNGLTASESNIKAASDKLADAITGAFKGRNVRIDDVLIQRVRATERQLLALADRREAIADRIKKANEFAVSTAASALQTGALNSVDVGSGGIAGLTNGLEAAVAQVRKFNTQVNALAKKGLRRDLLSQLIGLGPDQGAGLANTLSKATSAQLKDLNEAQKQLDAASKKLGRDSADSLFDAGANAAKGFLAGLKGQQKEIQDLMKTLALAMAGSIRKALGIRSPSTVFRGIGRYTMDGLDLGVRDRIAAVRRTAVGAADAVQGPFSRPGSTRSGNGASGSQNGSQGSSGRTVNVNQVFNLPSVDAKTLAEMSERRLVRSLSM